MALCAFYAATRGRRWLSTRSCLGVITVAVVATLGLLNAAILNLLSSVIALI